MEYDFEAVPEALQPRSSNVKVSGLSWINRAACLVIFLGGRFWPFEMVIVKAFDRTI